jgi:hypothetical protein
LMLSFLSPPLLISLSLISCFQIASWCNDMIFGRHIIGLCAFSTLHIYWLRVDWPT